MRSVRYAESQGREEIVVGIGDVDPPRPLVRIPELHAGGREPAVRSDRKPLHRNQVVFPIPFVMNDGMLQYLVKLGETRNPAELDGENRRLIDRPGLLDGLAHYGFGRF